MGFLSGKKAAVRVEAIAITKAGKKIRATAPKIEGGMKLGPKNPGRLGKRMSN